LILDDQQERTLDQIAEATAAAAACPGVDVKERMLVVVQSIKRDFPAACGTIWNRHSGNGPASLLQKE
jgi:hypothetical protein